MAIHIIDEANRCLNCKKPKCMEGCPVHTPIPHIIQMFKEHQVMDAGKELFQNNPMSVICSIVCDHEQQCAGHCVLGKKGNPVHFSSIENYISDTYLDRIRPLYCVRQNGPHTHNHNLHEYVLHVHLLVPHLTYTASLWKPG